MTFDTTPPTVLSINRAGSNPTNATSVQFTVTFSEPVSGVDVTDFVTAEGAGLSGSSVTSVSGGPTTYTVTVNTGSGDGTVGLNLVDNDSIHDALAYPLGGRRRRQLHRSGLHDRQDGAGHAVDHRQQPGLAVEQREPAPQRYDRPQHHGQDLQQRELHDAGRLGQRRRIHVHRYHRYGDAEHHDQLLRDGDRRGRERLGCSTPAFTYLHDNTAPTVINVTSPTANGTYGLGAVIPVTVQFSEPVNVTGTPQLTLSTGSPSTTAVNYASGSGTDTLTFNYTVATGNNSADLNYAATSSLALNGGTVKDLRRQQRDPDAAGSGRGRVSRHQQEPSSSRRRRPTATAP